MVARPAWVTRGVLGRRRQRHATRRQSSRARAKSVFSLSQPPISFRRRYSSCPKSLGPPREGEIARETGNPIRIPTFRGSFQGKRVGFLHTKDGHRPVRPPEQRRPSHTSGRRGQTAPLPPHPPAKSSMSTIFGEFRPTLGLFVDILELLDISWTILLSSTALSDLGVKPHDSP